MTRQIIQNELECLHCGDIIFSAHRHDFKYCKCGSVAVDGGMYYLLRVGDFGHTAERSMSMDKEHLKNVIAAVDWGKDTGRNSLGIALAVIRALREDDLLNMKEFEREHEGV
jgi:hypothetical protein